MVTVQPQQDGYLAVQLQIGQLCQSGIWISYTPELKTIAQGDTPDASFANLCEQVQEVCKCFQEMGWIPSFQAVNSADSLQPYPFRKAILVTVQQSVSACAKL